MNFAFVGADQDWKQAVPVYLASILLSTNSNYPRAILGYTVHSTRNELRRCQFIQKFELPAEVGDLFEISSARTNAEIRPVDKFTANAPAFHANREALSPNHHGPRLHEDMAAYPNDHPSKTIRRSISIRHQSTNSPVRAR